MAQGPMQRNIIDDFENVVNQLIQEAARFAAEGPGEGATQEDAEGNIRRLRVLSGALNAALQSLQFMPRPPTAPPVAPEPQQGMPQDMPQPAAAPSRPAAPATPPPRR